MQFRMPRMIPLVSVCLIFVAWIVLLGGVAAMDDKIKASSDDMRPLWWGCFFQFFVSCLYAFALFTGVDGEWATVIVSMAGMVATYLMINTDKMLSCDNLEECQAAAAGSISCCIVDMIVMILYGNERLRQKVYEGVERVATAAIPPPQAEADKPQA
eukprot:TRINITY_DN11907_c0_g1_i1.p1 TRINITY_DN11907_c0_g1~~TRINITY_DN11907_c0_g1_i1.p1  ORF type:complete len:157 (+),score=28.61 TRINITY_DN11907_c0_g1_i1:79-549(+)